MRPCLFAFLLLCACSMPVEDPTSTRVSTPPDLGSTEAGDVSTIPGDPPYACDMGSEDSGQNTKEPLSVWCEKQRDDVCRLLERMAEEGVIDPMIHFYLCIGPGRDQFICST